MRQWTITGLDGLTDDWGISEPYWATEVIRSRLAAGQSLSERDIEDIAYRFSAVWSGGKA